MHGARGGGYVELEFTVADDAHPVVRLSGHLDCRLELLDAVQRRDGSTTAFFLVQGAPPHVAVDRGDGSMAGDDFQVVERYDDECVVSVTLPRSVFSTLADDGIPLQSLTVADGTARWIAAVPPNRDPASVVSVVGEHHPEVELVGKACRETAAPFVNRAAFQTVLENRLTDRQYDVLRLAFEEGYFERPRRVTQVELADRLDISASTFGQHLHAALRKLLGTLFTEGFS